MKYCLSSRQESSYLKKCDEIKVAWNDRKIIFDLVEKYPGKRIDLRKMYQHSEPIDWNEIQQIYKLTQGNMLFGLSNMNEIRQAKQRDIPWYYLEPVRTFEELNSLHLLGAAAAVVAPPIFFQMDKVVKFNIPIRATANITPHVLPVENNVAGSWIRPEDVELYEDYIDCIDFKGVNLDQEQALFRIYAEQHKWPSDLGLIISDLNYLGTNRMISPEVGKARLTCGQRCQDPTGTCRICYRALDLADPERVAQYLERTKEN